MESPNSLSYKELGHPSLREGVKQKAVHCKHSFLVSTVMSTLGGKKCVSDYHSIYSDAESAADFSFGTILPMMGMTLYNYFFPKKTQI
ncbi:hypothetical protein FACS189445_2540 [Spirochaetia bacterium]|nr:hypothetical protein FACS189445_2540 [Spirochaetia bacterium]